MRTVRKPFMFALAAVLYLSVFGNPLAIRTMGTAAFKAPLFEVHMGPMVLDAQTSYYPPTVYQTSGTAFAWTAGNLNNGGHAVSVITGTGSSGAVITINETSCAAPTYSSCNFVYANNQGAVAVTTSLTAATASGNIMLAYVESSATAITNIVYPTQSSVPYLPTVMFNCGTAVACVQTYQGGIKMVFGNAPLTSASPSTASITNLPFASSTSYVCSASPVGTTAAIAAAGIAVNITSGTAMTLTGPNTVSTVVNFTCMGQ